MSLVARFSIPHVVTCCLDCPYHNSDNYGDWHCYHKDVASSNLNTLVEQNYRELTPTCPLVADGTAKEVP